MTPFGPEQLDLGAMHLTGPFVVVFVFVAIFKFITITFLEVGSWLIHGLCFLFIDGTLMGLCSYVVVCFLFFFFTQFFVHHFYRYIRATKNHCALSEHSFPGPHREWQFYIFHHVVCEPLWPFPSKDCRCSFPTGNVFVKRLLSLTGINP